MGASDAREGGGTLRTRVYDDLGQVPWPADVDGRALRSRFAELHPDGVPEQVRLRILAASLIHSTDDMSSFSLTSTNVMVVGMID